MSKPIFHLIYVSTAIELIDQPELEALLDEARANNRRLGVTGMLLYDDGNFMQALEGEEATVRMLAERIRRDTRHGDMSVVMEYTSPAREFPGWDMAFRQLGRHGDGAHAFIDLVHDRERFERALGQHGPARVWLETFRDNVR
ncbi:MAG: BLUF domain-containing protein [Candidatus Eiseniibacteriota bacterium]